MRKKEELWEDICTYLDKDPFCIAISHQYRQISQSTPHPNYFQGKFLLRLSRLHLHRPRRSSLLIEHWLFRQKSAEAGSIDDVHLSLHEIAPSPVPSRINQPKRHSTKFSVKGNTPCTILYEISFRCCHRFSAWRLIRDDRLPHGHNRKDSHRRLLHTVQFIASLWECLFERIDCLNVHREHFRFLPRFS